jgi:hypothetical protein
MMRLLTKFPLLALMLVVTCGCTTVKISGSQGTQFSGKWRTTAHEQQVSDMQVPWSFTVGGDLNQFEECAFEKSDRQGQLVVEVHRGWWRKAARVEAPPGVSGVRARKSGSEIVMETIP